MEASIGHLYCKALKLPDSLIDSRYNQLAMFMTVHSSRVTWDRQIDPEFAAKLGPMADGLAQNFFKIYFENSARKRLIFFCEPLVQHLWTIFRDDQALMIKEYLQKVRKQPFGAEKLIKLAKNASQLQEALDFKVFP